MLIRRHSPGYNFIGDTETGVTMRWGHTTGENPLSAPWPELADISISNHCSKGCGFCYRSRRRNNSFLSVVDYEFVLDSLTSTEWGSVFQVALGGGEPLEHPDFLEIVERTTARQIGVNFTTNGDRLTNAMASSLSGKVGAVALSCRSLSALDTGKVRILTEAGIRTNLHYVLDRTNIHEATELLEGRLDHCLDGVNSVIFLTYKPAGRGSVEHCLHRGRELEGFLQAVDARKTCVHVGFDACMVPLLLHSTAVDPDYIDPCECAFFSVYIDELLNVKPCSFARPGSDAFSLRTHSFTEIWNRCFEPYRQRMLASRCRIECVQSTACRGTCDYYSELALCG